MKITLDFDDFSPRNSSFGLLEELREHYPTFKVTLFTVPWEVRFSDPTPITDYVELKDGSKERKYKAWIEAVKEYDWMEIAVHGLTHTPEEFLNINYEDARKRIMVAEKMFINTGIPYTKLFKAPFWQLSEAGKKAAEDLGFIVAEDHYYNWNLKDEMPFDLKTGKRVEEAIGHGHIHLTSGNGLEEVIHKIYQLPTDTDFRFLSEHFGSQKIDPSKLDFRDPLEQLEIKWKGETL